jgi:serine/threonine protein kinase
MAHCSIPPYIFCRVARDVINALFYMHQNSFLHLNVQPENIMLQSENEIERGVLAHFRMAIQLQEDVETASEFYSPLPHCLPPEYGLEPPRLSSATDIWFFGVALYHTLTGRYPFRATDGVLQREEVEAPQIRSQLQNTLALRGATRELRAGIDRTMRFDPADRPTAEDLLQYSCFPRDLEPLEPRSVRVKGHISTLRVPADNVDGPFG